MAVHPPDGRTRTSPRDGKPSQQETRAAEVLTVAWAIVVMTLVICELMGILAVAYLQFDPDAEGPRALVSLLHFCALVLAVVAMGVLPVLYRVRRVPPPTAFIVFAVVAALVPLLIALWYAVEG